MYVSVYQHSYVYSVSQMWLKKYLENRPENFWKAGAGSAGNSADMSVINMLS